MSNKITAKSNEPSGKTPMHIQVTTDTNIKGHDDLIKRIEGEARHILSHFSVQIMTLEIHFTDENGPKHGRADKRCLMEARCSGKHPVAVSAESETLEGAFKDATKKLQRLLGASLGKGEAHKGVASIRSGHFAESEELS